MRKAGPRELVGSVQKPGLCIGCGACVMLCPHFRRYRHRTVQVFDCDLENGRCHEYCPKAAVDYGRLSERLLGEEYRAADAGNYEKAFAARAGRAAPAGEFQGGGTVSALVGFALKQGLIDAAVLTDREGLEPVGRLAAAPEEAAACSGSKFTAAPTLAAFNQARKEGRRRLGVVGTPCQMTALAQMRALAEEGGTEDEPPALTIGLFCNWALDPAALAGFLAERLNVDDIAGMDIPPPPADVLVVRTSAGAHEIPLSEIRPLIPETCFVCPDLTSEWADVSVGMFEGRPGWNTVLVRTPAGRNLVEEAEKAGWLETQEMPEENLGHLLGAARSKKERSLRTAFRRDLLDTGQGKDGAVLIMPTEAVDRLLS